jgi:hypothetical protein
MLTTQIVHDGLIRLHEPRPPKFVLDEAWIDHTAVGHEDPLTGKWVGSVWICVTVDSRYITRARHDWKAENRGAKIEPHDYDLANTVFDAWALDAHGRGLIGAFAYNGPVMIGFVEMDPDDIPYTELMLSHGPEDEMALAPREALWLAVARQHGIMPQWKYTVTREDVTRSLMGQHYNVVRLFDQIAG